MNEQLVLDDVRVLSTSPLRVVLLTGPSKDFWWEISVMWRKENCGPWEQRQVRLNHDEMEDLVRNIKYVRKESDLAAKT